MNDISCNSKGLTLTRWKKTQYKGCVRTEKMVTPEGGDRVDEAREERNKLFLGNEKHSGLLQYAEERVMGSYRKCKFLGLT